MKNVALYYRTSTDKQDLASQRHEVEKWLEALPAEKKPLKVYVYHDEGISGKTTNRPGFKDLLDAAFRKKIDTIIVFRLDRFSRQATAAIRLILQLDEAGVAFISVSQPVLNLGHENPFRRTMLSAFAEIAEIERENIVARVVAGLEAAKKRGVVLGAPKKLTPEKKELAEKLRQEGQTIRAIAKTLALSVGSVANLLRNAPSGEAPQSE